MQSTLLIDLFSLLKTREKTKFQEFVYSPVFNKNEKVRCLCDFICRFKPPFIHKKLTRENAFKAVFENKTYDEIQLNNVISDLLELLYRFLAWKEMEEEESLKKQYLLGALLKKEAGQHIERQAGKWRASLNKTKVRNFEHHLDLYFYHEKKDRYAMTKPERRFDENLQLYSDELDLFYFSNKLRIACDMTSRNLVIKATYHCAYLDEILAYYKMHEDKLSAIPAIQLYYTALLMLKKQDAIYFHKIKNKLLTSTGIFPQQELWTVYNYALNFCIIKINSGENEFYYEILELYKALLETGIIFLNGYLTQWDFKNIVTVGLRTKNFDWAENFIFQYKTKLLEQEQNNAFTYNLAALFYEKKNYKKALQQLHNVEFTDASYHLGAKIIQLKSYYELEETEALFALIEAFKKYISRNKQLANYKKKANNNFLKIVRKIYQLKIEKTLLDKSVFMRKHENLVKEMERMNPLANKGWLEDSLKKMSA